MFDGMIVNLVSAIAEHNAMVAWVRSLPKAEADKIRAQDALLAIEKEKHRRNMEIANAGRPRNFWGK